MPLETLEQVQKAGRERLYPSLTNPNWLILSKRRELLVEWLKNVRSENAFVLDVGGRIQPYRALLPGARYIAIDLRRTPLVSVVASADQIPFPNDGFDLVFCTQVLEYVPDPGFVVSEMHRVLKPGGMLVLSVPSIFPRDADEDRWRFLPAGIRQLLSAFSKVEIVAEGGSVAGFFRTVNVGLYLFARYSFLRTLLSYSLIPILNLMGLCLEAIAHSQNDVFAANYSAMARK
jgi:SAM-dependent methyltransferase